MAKINENCWAKCSDGRRNWVKKMNTLGSQGWRIIWQSYKESEDEQTFSAYFYREKFISKAEFEENQKE
jgi:hypothetical protein